MPDPRIASLLAFARQDGRISPMPRPWVALHRMIGEEAPKPMILAGWWLDDWMKLVRVEEQLIFAADHGRLDRADRFLRRLPDDEWHRNDDPAERFIPLLFRPGFLNEAGAQLVRNRAPSSPRRQLGLF